VPWPADLKPEDVSGASLIMELSAKRLLGKDREGAKELSGDFMLGEGTHDPSRSPNSYPMTDETPFPSAVTVKIAGSVAAVTDLEDDPADHRGILSWHSQPRDYSQPQGNVTSFRPFKGGTLHEAGSYGYLVTARIQPESLRRAAAEGEFAIRLEVDDALPGGLAVYGERFGRYPLDPTLVFMLKD
jgi:predicted transcriptional regulator